jgi:hypothetical protein
MRDIRDLGTPGEKEWAEFQVTFASAFLHVWLQRELGIIAPDYLKDLKDRIYAGIDWSDLELENDPEYDGGVPVELPDGSGHEWWPAREGRLLADQLFPHRRSEEDYVPAARGLAVVAIHAALENYCASSGIDLRRQPLPKALGKYLAGGGIGMEAEVFADLVDLDETRHLFVHHRGVVSQRYCENVPYGRLVAGEFRVLTDNDLFRFSKAAWNAAIVLRATRLKSPDESS